MVLNMKFGRIITTKPEYFQKFQQPKQKYLDTIAVYLELLILKGQQLEQ